MQANWPIGYKTVQRPWIIVLDRMISLDILKTLTAVWSVLVVIIVSKKFIKVLERAIEGQVSNETLIKILGLKTLVASVDFLPAALFMAILMVLGRMYRDQEMSAVASAGGGSGTIYRSVFLLVLPLSILAAGLSLQAAPWAEDRMEHLISRDEQSADLRGIAEGKFSEYSQGDLVVYVEKITKNNEMQKVFVQQRGKGKLGIINAGAAQIHDLEHGRYVVFNQGERIQGIPGRLNFISEQFDEYGVRIDEKESAVKYNRAALSTLKLWDSKLTYDMAELQRRFSIPLGTLLLSFLAIPLAQISPRGGVYGNMLIGFLIYFCYGNLLRVSEAWVIKGTLTAAQSGAAVNSIMLLVGMILLARLYGWQWLRIRIRKVVSG
ncbi:MAG: LPS export ABC transporter permease LptF [Gammaproteobacteria bacterium]